MHYTICRTLLLLLGLLYVFQGIGCKEETCTTHVTCPSGQLCNFATQRCQPRCTSDQDCVGTQKCQQPEGRCQEPICETRASKRCVQSKLYWFSSCGKQEEIAQDCGIQGCEQGACKGSASTCPNGTCDPGSEDCLSCPEDCKCQPGERCDNGACQVSSTCGNGVCDTQQEDCSSCAQDCACETGKLCSAGTCIVQSSCGNGICEAAQKENCMSCARDCTCPMGQQCDANSITCEHTCGDGKCEAKHGENCSSCAQDCACTSGQKCVQGTCSTHCGNGLCESSFGENCSTCSKDCPCGANQRCNAGGCGNLCGNGVCDKNKGENCSTCRKDCACTSSEICNTGKCTPRCGDGFCDKNQGETCSTCSKDCACSSHQSCVAGNCILHCGDGKCDPNRQENCSTCPKDCACKNNRVCKGGQCADSICGTCPGRTECIQGQCTCKHECTTLGASTCENSTTYKRCSIDAQGCRYWKSVPCATGRSCKQGSCCDSGCKPGQECGKNACGESCGTCHARASCKKDKCVCNHACSRSSLTQCTGSRSYKVCLTDGKGCRYWSSSLVCPNFGTCQRNVCCKRQCTYRECGSDSCGGSCGSCTYACINNQCRRKIYVASVYLPCSLCSDSVVYVKADPYVKLTLSNGQTFSSLNQEDICDQVVTFKWSVPNVDPGLLRSATLEVYDRDKLDSDDLCVKWQGDFSKVGKRSLKSKGATLTLEIRK